MTDLVKPSPSSHTTTAPERPAITLPARAAGGDAGASDSWSGGSDGRNPRAELAKVIPRRPRVAPWLGLVFAVAFALLITPAVTADRWMASFGAGEIVYGKPAGMTVRVAPFAGQNTREAHIGGGGIVIARGTVADRAQVDNAHAVMAATPAGAVPFLAFFVLAFVFAAIFTHHMQRSTKGRLVRVQVVSLVTVAAVAIAVKVLMLTTAMSILVVPVALLAMLPTMVLDRVVGLATGILAALVTSLMIPFDVSVAILLLVQAASAGLVVSERPKDRWRAAITAGAMTTLFTAGTYVLLAYLTTGAFPTIDNAWSSPLVATALGPVIATVLVVPLLPLYQLLVGEITHGKLIALEDLSNPLLRQIAEKAPGTWQHSLMMANMAEIAANAIGASGRLVRVGAYYHDLGKSLQPKYFIENLEPGETSPHDQLPPEVSCDAIFAHVTEGIVTARRAGLHERVVDFMHMHHGNGVLEYFWSRCREQGNPRGFTIENFRYPGHPPQSRETAILAICDAVEAASRTLKKPEPAAIDSLVQRIVYGKLHLGQLDESGLSMSDLRRISDSLRETIRHANHGRIEYPWQKAQQDASASRATEITGTQPRLDSLDRKPVRDTSVRSAQSGDDAAAPRRPRTTSQKRLHIQVSEEALATADLKRPDPDLGILETAPAMQRGSTAGRDSSPPRDSHDDVTRPRPRPRGDSQELDAGIAQGRTSAKQVRQRTESEDLAMSRAGTAPADPSEEQSAADDLALSRAISEDFALSRTESQSFARFRRPSEMGSAQHGAMELGPPPELITPATFGEPPPAARKRAATLPPVPRSRAPSVQPLADRSHGVVSPMAAASARTAGPPAMDDLENATTNPPPIRRTLLPPVANRLPAMIIEDEHRTTAPRTAQAAPDDAGSTEPSMRVQLPLLAPASDPGIALPAPADVDPAATPSGDPLKRAVDLASRIDAARDRDEWSAETPVVAPTKAELRALLGVPDPTRKQSLAELERLHRESIDEEPSDPGFLRQRSVPHVTAEVDPDDIESAIELAPPARRALGVAKPKKPTP
ncbi:MAG: HDIG domain-containing protein [Myxococcota bacterium]|nr:HDIG domain-containing protein [Myxococcota bacterium]